MAADDLPPRTAPGPVRPIDRDGLAALAARGVANPEARGTNVVRVRLDGQFRSTTTIGDHPPLVIDEPLHLLGENRAPAPGEFVLAALGGCLCVGIQAVATWAEVTLHQLELHLEGDIGNPAAWGAGGAEPEPDAMGFQAIRVRVTIAGDASADQLEEIVTRANHFSPVANSLRNPIPVTVDTA